MVEIKLHHIVTLAELLLKGGKHGYVPISTRELGKSIGRSQQAASKHLLELEGNGYIERKKIGQSFYVRVTEKGYEEVQRLVTILNAALDRAKGLRFEGVIIKGMGEGAYYMSLEGYRKQFVEKLGFEPYPGTLNLKLDQVYINTKSILKLYPGIMIEGFSDGKRTYGWVKCYPATINEIEGAILILERTHHDDSILEIIAPVNIMEKTGIDYGGRLSVSIQKL